MRLLVIGGTVFVGRAVVDAALARGHDVTIFHRGQHGEAAHPGVPHIHGDRVAEIGLVADGGWDAVVDTCGFDAATVAASAAALSQVPHYGFVSSISAYRDWPAVPADEMSPVKEADHEDAYGAGKVAAERTLATTFGDRLCVSRPGLIAGPHENIGRLPFWLRYAARGGKMLAPAPPDEGRQWVDARDLAEWHVASAEQRLGGIYNTVSPAEHFTMRELVDECVRVTGAAAEARWVEPERIVDAGIQPWTELPVWLWDKVDDMTHTWSVDVTKAFAAGFVARPMTETVQDTWEWLSAGRDDADGYRAELAVQDLDPDKERIALAAR
jgi:nucleoside-diphosphate-sugar epimerase